MMFRRHLYPLFALTLATLLIAGLGSGLLLRQAPATTQAVELGTISPDLQQAAFIIDDNGGFAGGLYAPQGSGQVVYIAAAGDTSESVAARFGVTTASLLTVNGLKASDKLAAGDQLVIPASTTLLVSAKQPLAAPAAVVKGIAPAVAEVKAAVPAAKAAPAQPLDVANVDSRYVVQTGDNLSNLAARYGVSVEAVAAANRITDPNLIQVGQTLTLPARNGNRAVLAVAPDQAAPLAAKPAVSVEAKAAEAKSVAATVAEAKPAPTLATHYTVQPGDNLSRISTGYGLSAEALARANGLDDENVIYVGQVLNVPAAGQAASAVRPPAPQPAVKPKSVPKRAAPDEDRRPAPVTNAGGRWIDVDISKQRLTAYEGDTAVFSTIVSTGVRSHPTVVGDYAIYVKYVSTSMSGPGYNIAYVPSTMYFYGGYAIHGAPWNNNLGTPQSHGCVNLSVAAAKWMFDWASVGTPVHTHW